MFPGAITAQNQFPAEEIIKIEKMDISEQDSRISEISQRKRKAGDDDLNLSPKVLNPLDGELDEQRSIKKLKLKSKNQLERNGTIVKSILIYRQI